MVGQNVQIGDGVVGHLVGVRIEDLNHAVGSLAPAQGHGDHRAHPRRLDFALLLKPRIMLRFWNDQRFAVLNHPAGHALAHLDAQAAQRRLLSSGGDGVVEFLGGVIEHQQRPLLGLDEALHMFKDGAQDGIQFKARCERAS